MPVLEYPFVKNDEKGLREFIIKLASPACPKYTMNIDQLDGYLRAIAVEPKATDAKDWMPLVFGGEFPCYIDGYSTESITNALIWLYNSHRVQVLSERCELEFVCTYTLDREQWARGFMQGYIFWQDIWNQYDGENQTSFNLAVILPLSAYDEIDDILAIIGAIADTDYAIQNGATTEVLMRMFDQLPEKVIEYGRIAHIIRTTERSERETGERLAPNIH